MVAQAYNPNYLVGRDWKDHSSRSAQAKSLKDPVSTNDWPQYYTPVIPAR
jgi:hypothetical protein